MVFEQTERLQGWQELLSHNQWIGNQIKRGFGKNEEDQVIQYTNFYRCNRGLRHHWGLKVRGQHTKTTGRGGQTLGVERKKKWFCYFFSTLLIYDCCWRIGRSRRCTQSYLIIPIQALISWKSRARTAQKRAWWITTKVVLRQVAADSLNT